ncbi:hypothetical protein GCM10007973_25950 [Polymorphobacter multimanifer]|uniref:pilus assembly protein TadG-related protein n=1 Tax=Polymorphobacter multimanifer TaxID=1070431 RepID=UPI0016637198|nr:pilus assembly protein TadG-related protein [Polymorphobacter multimanifer]GGI88402.1 hypothetical protein GCM10007973_25950 [Polymorphobacter multimanifer]
MDDWCRRLGSDGNVAAIFAITLPVLLGTLGLAVDGGRMAIESTRMQAVADSAALAGSMQLGGDDASAYGTAADGSKASSAAVIEAVQSVIEANLGAAGALVVPPGAIVTGHYDIATKVFSSGGSGANAVRIVAGETAAGGNPFPLVFGPFLGRDTVDISSAATALGGSSCTASQTFSYLSTAKPNRAAVVTMGENVGGVNRYLMSSDGHPIIRVDSSIAARITIQVSGKPNQIVDTPGQGSFWHKLTGISVTPAPGTAATITLVSKVLSSVPDQTKGGGTATWNNVIREVDKLPGTEICTPGAETAAPRLVG